MEKDKLIPPSSRYFPMKTEASVASSSSPSPSNQGAEDDPNRFSQDLSQMPDFPVATAGRTGVDTSAHGDGLKYVFKVSVDLTRFEYYTIGSYRRDMDKYVPDNTSPDNGTGLRFDYRNFYASKTFFDAGKQRRILLDFKPDSSLNFLGMISWYYCFCKYALPDKANTS